ncbi:MAG: hypothetical protein EA365_16890 [Gloeocapsa sp. DLM2.Bin57]|nr:MAG: hypothetical protein EA365_16890 [Gloeocapsa sp. DLM2.Bin57]
MSKFSPDDPKLSAFLRQYRPLPPDASIDLEVELMDSLPPRVKKTKYLPWLLTAIATGLLLTWTGYQNYRPILRYTSIQRDLEAFLIDNWEETLEMEISAIEW